MHLFLFIIALLVSFIVVRVGAIAFQLTGMAWPMAKFQALSCFSGTGFTTRESECITNDPRRRKIASLLMILGNAGVVTLVATFANTIRPNELAFSLPGLSSNSQPWVNLLVIAGAFYLAYKFFSHSKAGARFTNYLRTRIKASGMAGPVSLEELTVATGGYGVIQLELSPGNPLIGLRLAEADLRKKDITVLVVCRGFETFVNPKPDVCFAAGDLLMCFGNLDTMKTAFA